jgi:hypothetical protein
VLLFILVANWGWGLYLDHYNLVYSTLGVVYGAGDTADHVTRIALWIMVGVSAVGCALLALNFFRPRFWALLAGCGVYVGLYVIGILLLPVVFQKFFVQPSELALETPYLKNYIEFTRNAYQLDAIQETAYPALSDLTSETIARNQDTIQNIRLWDARPLLQTYQQTQAIRLYYQFYNVNTDRYHLADGYHQVMLSTRELAPELPSLLSRFSCVRVFAGEGLLTEPIAGAQLQWRELVFMSLSCHSARFFCLPQLAYQNLQLLSATTAWLIPSIGGSLLPRRLYRCILVARTANVSAV